MNSIRTLGAGAQVSRATPRQRANRARSFGSRHHSHSVDHVRSPRRPHAILGRQAVSNERDLLICGSERGRTLSSVAEQSKFEAEHELCRGRIEREQPLLEEPMGIAPPKAAAQAAGAHALPNSTCRISVKANHPASSARVSRGCPKTSSTNPRERAVGRSRGSRQELSPIDFSEPHSASNQFGP